eukprot:10227638-Karenia_brevis.AAC.1
MFRQADAEAAQHIDDTWTEAPNNDLLDWIEESTVAIDEITATDDGWWYCEEDEQWYYDAEHDWS